MSRPSQLTQPKFEPTSMMTERPVRSTLRVLTSVRVPRGSALGSGTTRFPAGPSIALYCGWVDGPLRSVSKTPSHVERAGSSARRSSRRGPIDSLGVDWHSLLRRNPYQAMLCHCCPGSALDARGLWKWLQALNQVHAQPRQRLNVSRPRRPKPSSRNPSKFGGSGSIHPEARILSMRNTAEKDKPASLQYCLRALNRVHAQALQRQRVLKAQTLKRGPFKIISSSVDFLDRGSIQPEVRNPATEKYKPARSLPDGRNWGWICSPRRRQLPQVDPSPVLQIDPSSVSNFEPAALERSTNPGPGASLVDFSTAPLGKTWTALTTTYCDNFLSMPTQDLGFQGSLRRILKVLGSVARSWYPDLSFLNPEFLWFPVRFATLDYSGGILAARFRIPYEDVDELEVARHVTERSLTTQPIIARFAPDNAHAIRLARGGIQATSSSDLRGRLYLELSLRELFRRRLPPVVLRPLVEEIVKVVEKVLDTSGSAHHLQRLIGTMAEAGGNEGYDCAMRFLEERLEDVLENLWERCMEFVDRVDLLVQPVDRLHKLLLRLRKFTDDQTSRPVRVADLHPAVADNKAPSKRSLCDQSPFLAVADAHPDLPQFLQAVADMEILSDGAFPCILPSMQEHAWAPLLETTIGRPSMVALGQRVLHAFVVDLILERLKRGGGSADAEILLPILTSNRTLLNSLFRMGVYQEVSSCPFDGSEASYPATAMRLYWAMLQENSLGHHDIVKTAVRNTFEVLVDVLFDAHRFHMEHTANAEALSPKKRKILAPTQGIDMAKDNIPQAPGRENAPPVHPRRAGRTTIPTIVIARRKPAASTSSDSMPHAPTAHLASSLA
ncbi:hypothetical protein DFH06DRAFT_1145427 [Mycena polygramma]|nr:hypothetical protein DFH06DRAFT_1145427 [Mycena polygramma]